MMSSSLGFGQFISLRDINQEIHAYDLVEKIARDLTKLIEISNIDLIVGNKDCVQPEGKTMKHGERVMCADNCNQCSCWNGRIRSTLKHCVKYPKLRGKSCLKLHTYVSQ